MARKIGKLIGAVGNLFAIPDAINAVKHVADKASPIIEKELDRRHTHKQSLIALDNVIDVPLDYAVSHLEAKGFTVLPILSKPKARFANERPMEVVAMHPKPGHYEANRLIKLYFVDDEVIAMSQALKTQETQPLKNLQEHVNQHLNKVKAVKLPLGKKKP